MELTTVSTTLDVLYSKDLTDIAGRVLILSSSNHKILQNLKTKNNQIEAIYNN
jgi:peptidoglycan hydrolase CwlO-like protein